jgi:uncharacterized protein YndB with AHSA1/START domain
MIAKRSWSSLRHAGSGAALALALIVSGRACAEVTDSAPNGFGVRETVHIAAANDKVYAALITPQRWWSSDHTFSHNAANLNLDAHAGGCWCETLPDGGSVQHMIVVFAAPGKLLRLRGALGPFQAMAVDSVLTWTLAPTKDGTDVTLVSTTGGYTPGGLEPISKIADRVFAEQVARLKAFIETGSPEIAQEKKP